MKFRAHHLALAFAVITASVPVKAGPGIQYWQKHGSTEEAKPSEQKQMDTAAKTETNDSSAVATKATPATDKKTSDTEVKKSASAPAQTVAAKSS